MSGHVVVGPTPLLEESFDRSGAVFGPDRTGYRNHVHRIFYFARALGTEGPEPEHKASDPPLQLLPMFHG